MREPRARSPASICSMQPGFALMTAFAGALYCQYQMFISPDTVSGISVSLQMAFAAIVGALSLVSFDADAADAVAANTLSRSRAATIATRRVISSASPI